MEQVIHRPLSAVMSTVTMVQKAGRLLLPLAVALAITGGGLLVFFALVSALLL
ncbi:hypothetical protein HYG81_12720 [Natrinema zhouii]|uniref:Uncharacterized protein n=1 Tax=Natrinema zhouii TaxID=1710539 RepID=A0A7D6H442_9EURY|nr:hypothetical protein [Natrinema zhouii]QLK24968.1 hypothetical protein HYG81_12720 [Natrinema zhouii]